MTRTITRLFDDHAQAERAVSALEAAGVDEGAISLIANNSDGRHAGRDNPQTHELNAGEAAEGAGKGATAGGVLGAAGGLLAGLAVLAIPGVGPVIAGGWLASTVIGAVAGAAVGGVTGGLLGALKDAGHSDDEAQVYAEGVRRGGALVSVRADDARADEVEAILNRQSGVDAAMRGADYREAGWDGFHHDAPALSGEDLARERARYVGGEARSFGGEPRIGGMTDAADEKSASATAPTGTYVPPSPLRGV